MKSKDEITIRLKIRHEKFYNNGKIILNAISPVEKSIRDALSQEEKVKATRRTPKGKTPFKGVNARSLNKALRNRLIDKSINLETHVENGIFFHTEKKGFDFSVYDKNYNLAHLYNYYRGSVGILNGDEKIIDLYKKMGDKKEDWENKIKDIKSKVGPNSDYVVEKESLTVVGELQFGNWALIYRDLFRLLDADNDPGIDFYIYVSADDKLSKKLSKNTVSYNSADKVISENLSIIKTPIWLIGLEYEEI